MLDIALDVAHGLVRESLQPESPCQRDVRRHALIELEAHGIGSLGGRNVALEHALDVPPCAGLVAEEMQRGADHAITDEGVSGVGRARRKTLELSCERQRLPELAVVDATGP